MTEAAAVHVVGAGLAGLAAAVSLAAAGRRVILYEAGPQAGGRCRSYFDHELGCRLDNGNHLLLTGNRAALAYIDRIGARERFFPPAEPIFPFVDLATGERWVLRPNRGRVPWWILRAGRRVPGSRARDYLAAARLRRAGDAATVAAMLEDGGVLYRRLWEPLAVAALNTAAAAGSARLFGRVLAETLERGAAACRPLIPREGLSEGLIDPALAALRRRGAAIHFGTRLRALHVANGQIAALAFDDGARPLAAGDAVILAIPAAVAARLVTDLVVPAAYAPIVNAHYRHPAPPQAPPFLGIIGGTAEWVFRKPGVISVTVSAADALVDQPSDDLRDLLWRDIASAYRLAPVPVPPARILKERRATFLASPAQLARRPGTATRWRNLLLAGDYVDTGLPATIEGAIRSGHAAAEYLRISWPAAITITASSVNATSRQHAPAAENQKRAYP